MQNKAIQVIISFCALLFFANWIIDPSIVKQLVDFAVLAASLMLFFRWLPNSLESLKAGGAEKKFRLSLGITLFAAAIVAQRMYIIIVGNGMLPQWVDQTAIGSFIASWIFGAMALCISIDDPPDMIKSPLKLYYILISIAFGVLIGIGISQMFFV